MAERKIRIIIFLHYEKFVLVKNYISLKAQLLEKKPMAVLIFYILFMLNLCFFYKSDIADLEFFNQK